MNDKDRNAKGETLQVSKISHLVHTLGNSPFVHFAIIIDPKVENARVIFIMFRNPKGILSTLYSTGTHRDRVDRPFSCARKS